MDAALSKVPALEPKTLLRRLAEESHALSMTLMLNSGASVRGTLVSASKDVVLLETDSSLAYVPLPSVVSVIVHHARSFVDVLSFGAVDTVPDDPPTKLGLRRELQSRGATLSGALDKEVQFRVEKFPEDKQALWSLSLGVRDLHTAVIAIAAEADGADALRELVDVVSVCEGSSPGVTLASRTLSFAISTDKGPEGRLSSARLREAIESLL